MRCRSRRHEAAPPGSGPTSCPLRLAEGSTSAASNSSTISGPCSAELAHRVTGMPPVGSSSPGLEEVADGAG
jgi:hypothetical protein